MRTDLLIVWPAGAPPDRTRRMVIECRVLRRTSHKPWDAKVFLRTERAAGIPITVWGM